MTISAIVCVYNTEKYIIDALESIRDQSQPVDEILVVDDGSTDKTLAFVKNFQSDKLRIISKKHTGVPNTRNVGLSQAKGELIAFLDADDIWLPNKTSTQLQFLQEHPNIDMVIGMTQVSMLEKSSATKSFFSDYGKPSLHYSLGASMIRRRVFEAVGQFDESLALTDDWDYFLRAQEKGFSIHSDTNLAQYYRRHTDNITNDTEVGDDFILKMLRKKLGRRRAENEPT